MGKVNLAKYLFPALLAAAGAVMLIYYNLGELQGFILTFLDWLETRGGWAPLIFILTDAVVVILLLPGAPFTLSAGFLFGFIAGGAYVIIGTTLGATIAFLIAKNFMGAKFAAFILRHPRLHTINHIFLRRGWGMIFLTRLIPFFPFKLSNYFFGLTGHKLKDFVGGTFFGIMPITLLNVYAGSVAIDLAMIGSGRTAKSTWHWVASLVGLFILAAMVIFITRRAGRIMARRMAEKNGKK